MSLPHTVCTAAWGTPSQSIFWLHHSDSYLQVSEQIGWPIVQRSFRADLGHLAYHRTHKWTDLQILSSAFHRGGSSWFWWLVLSYLMGDFVLPPLFIYSACIFISHFYIGSVGVSKLCTELTMWTFVSLLYMSCFGTVIAYSFLIAWLIVIILDRTVVYTTILCNM